MPYSFMRILLEKLMIIIFILLLIVNLLYFFENNSLHFVFSTVLFFMGISILRNIYKKLIGSQGE